MIFSCVKRTNTKIQIYKYTNTAYDKVPERPSMWYNTVAVLSLCQLSIVECSKSSKDFCTEIQYLFCIYFYTFQDWSGEMIWQFRQNHIFQGM